LNRGLVKNATGYDLRHLFIGAEGTLGFVVEATMKLTRPPVNLQVLLLSVVNLDALMEILACFSSGIELTAFEFFSDKALAHVVAHSDLTLPFSEVSPYYALLEFEMSGDATEEIITQAFESSMEAGWITDGVLSQSEAQLKNLWRYRENISEAITPYTPYKNDISVTQSNVPEFLSEVDRVVTSRYPAFELIWFGHIGDGNLHLNILKPAALEVDQFREQCEIVNECVFEIVEKFAGSISAEHGVGLLKKKYLSHTRSAAEIEHMKAIKNSFDPNGIMNPGKLI
jgi:FAD/FMN-containing dehydrogenase